MKAIQILFFSLAFTLSAFANAKTFLDVSSYTDYENSQHSLETAKSFKIDFAFVKKHYVSFYMFRDAEADDTQICFQGDAYEAAEIIEAILNVSTGDAWVSPAKARITKNTITQNVSYEDESGDNSFQLKVKRCQ